MDWENKRILITGVSSFICSNLTKELLSRGAKIYAIDNFSYIDKKIFEQKTDILGKVELIEGDVTLKETWEKVPEDIDYIFHLAAPSSITLFNKFPEKCYTETVIGLFRALEFSKNHDVKKIIYPTSGSNYAGNEMPHNESIYIKPRNLYAAAKMSCEALASSYSDFVDSIGLRIFGGYGPGEEWKRDFGSVIYLFIKELMEGKSPVIFGDGKQTRDFIYVEDIVKMIIRAAEIEDTGIINVGTGVATSFNELLETIIETLGTNLKPEYIPKDKNYVEDLRADTTKMKDLLGVEPIGIKEGIKQFIKYLQKEN